MKRCELLFGIGLAAVAAPLYTRVAQAWGIALMPQVKKLSSWCEPGQIDNAVIRHSATYVR